MRADPGRHPKSPLMVTQAAQPLPDAASPPRPLSLQVTNERSQSLHPSGGGRMWLAELPTLPSPLPGCLPTPRLTSGPRGPAAPRGPGKPSEPIWPRSPGGPTAPGAPCRPWAGGGWEWAARCELTHSMVSTWLVWLLSQPKEGSSSQPRPCAPYLVSFGSQLSLGSAGTPAAL